MEGSQEYVQETVNYWWGADSNDTLSSTNQTAYECANYMEPEVKVFWDVVYAVLVLFIVTIMIPWLCCCFRGRPRCLARAYSLSGLIHMLIGLLLATALLPLCHCNEEVCSVHRYNPTAGYGSVSVVIGFFWWVKACCLRRYARKVEQQAADDATATTGVTAAGRRSSTDKSDYTEVTLPDVV